MWLFRKRKDGEEEYEDDGDDDEYEDDDDEYEEEGEEYSDDDDVDNADHTETEPVNQSTRFVAKTEKLNGSTSEQTSGEDSAAPSENATKTSPPIDMTTTTSSEAKSTETEEELSTAADGVVGETKIGEMHENNSADLEDDEDNEKETDDHDHVEGKGEDEEEEAMSSDEKQGLLALAAEHDRVDIIKSILTEQEGDRDKLLHAGIPPLHTAVSFGSTNATQCLLRMGADPSIRPNIAELKAQGLAKSANVNRYDGVSAWELAFGREAGTTIDSTLTAAEAKRKYGPVKPVNMAPSKREGIRHAFTAEALRCIGADEANRLEQLLQSGMPADHDIGGKNLYDWAMEMGATGCQKVLRPLEDSSQSSEMNGGGDAEGKHRSAVLDRTTTPGEESVSQLFNRLVELDSLARALSSCLDNLAEEVSVCHGLLLMGGGASALAAHVRSLKDLQARQSEELERCLQEWEECEDELAYWLKEAGNRCDDIKTMINPVDELTTRRELYPTPKGPDEEEVQRRQLLAQIAASEHKVRRNMRHNIALRFSTFWLIKRLLDRCANYELQFQIFRRKTRETLRKSRDGA
jgi:ankyrin repeat protein